MTTQSRQNTGRRVEGPRRVRNGLRLGRDPESLQSDWLSQRWLAVIGTAVSETNIEEGLVYARAGQTRTFEVRSGGVVADVQGTRSRAYRTTLRVPQIHSTQWSRLIEAMAAEAIYTARLLSGELPESTEALFEACGTPLMPRGAEAIAFDCTCGAHGAPCKHAATVAWMAAERIASSPLVFFTLRGLPSEQVLERLRQARTLQARGTAFAHPEPRLNDDERQAPPLAECADRFWRAAHDVDAQSIELPEFANHALLRRLGPSLLGGKFPFAGLLATIYDTVADGVRPLLDDGVDAAEEEDRTDDRAADD